MDILILGDGNCSFSYSLLSRLVEQSNECNTGSLGVKESNIKDKVHRYICSTFDSISTLTEKYRDSAHFLQKIQTLSKKHNQKTSKTTGNALQVVVKHEIDASKDIISQLNLPEDYLFDIIVFNFPHLGIEDASTHASFLCHCIHQCKQTLKTNESVLYIALEQYQADRWKLKEQAYRNHMEIIDAVPLYLMHWPKYDVKRHQNNKSFKNKLDGKLFHYTITNITSSNNEISTRHLFRRLFESCLISVTSLASCSLSEDRYEVFVDDDNHISLFRCRSCYKTFESIQSVTIHYQYSHSQGNPSPSSYSCEQCHRCFDNMFAWEQHCISKHGQHNTVQTTNTKRKLVVLNESEITCPICDEMFLNLESLEDHLSFAFQPRDKTKSLACPNCDKKFVEERARQQHLNYCIMRTNIQSNDNLIDKNS